MNNFNNKKFDIAIIGSGIIGSLQALLLAQSGFDVLLLDAAKSSSEKYFNNNINLDLPPDLRMSAVTLRSEEILEQVGIIKKLQNRYGLIKNIHIWEENGPGALTFEAVSIGKNYLSKLIENNLLQEAINQSIESCNNITVIRPCIIHNIIKNNINIDNNIYQAELIIGADGGNSWVRDYFKFNTDIKNYDHSAIITTVYTSTPHNNTAYQQFLQDGPIAFLPFLTQNNQNISSIVWSQSPNNSKYWLRCEKQVFLDKLTSFISGKLGQVLDCDERLDFPLICRHSENYYKENCVLIGDAAHTIHPLAGQGLNLGIYDAAALTEVLIWAKENNYNLNNEYVLKKYDLRRRGHNQLVMNLMDFFKKLYSYESTGIQLLRNLGMNFIDQSNFLKKTIARQAAGY
ncbi:MAG: FAD-dependent monooxygenase [Gammaproteobacteria bacterium]|nr:FAD-dependent monooxygenase [Gammaproteobacteria bacterium]